MFFGLLKQIPRFISLAILQGGTVGLSKLGFDLFYSLLQLSISLTSILISLFTLDSTPTILYVQWGLIPDLFFLYLFLKMGNWNQRYVVEKKQRHDYEDPPPSPSRTHQSQFPISFLKMGNWNCRYVQTLI